MPQLERQKKWYTSNKGLANERSKAWYAERRDAIISKRRADFEAMKADPVRYAAYIESERQRSKRRYETATPEQRLRKAGASRAYRKRKPEANRRAARETHRRARRECLAAYGGKCACCGETIQEFLAIDHVNGGGNHHRRELRLKGKTLFFHLRSLGYPSGFQVLCHNCNQAKGFYGECPHVKLRYETAAPSSMGM